MTMLTLLVADNADDMEQGEPSPPALCFDNADVME